MNRIRVLVVEDSITIRKHLVEVLATDPDVEVVGEAGDGRQAIELCQALRPQVMTLDMMLPKMSGLAVTEYVMAYCPTPIVIVSASANRGEVFKTFEALAAGAVDVIEKPTGDETDGKWERQFVATVKLVSRIKVITHPRARLSLRDQVVTTPPPLAVAAPADGQRRLVAIGASTGGPSAVLDILRGLPSDFPLPILLVLHIGALFGASLAEWLDGQSPLRVKQATDGLVLPDRGQPGAFLAPPDRHLVVRGGRLCLTSDPERHSCRPSVDVLFESLATGEASGAIACLLTGMGRDGAAGLLDLRRAGAATVVQDEATSAVFGMPREAILLGAAERVLPLGDIPPALIGLAAAVPARKAAP
jgi:two-component system, chemotaxis family, protein-glutamate methylesterase/glutaminase